MAKKSTKIKESSVKSSKLTDEDKMKIRNQLTRDTGMPLRRIENYLQKFNWDLKKVYDYPTIASAVKKKKTETQKKAIGDVLSQSTKDYQPLEESAPRSKKKTKKTIDKHGFEIETDDVGHKYFKGKLIKNDASGLYAPYLSQKDIISWMKTYGRQTEPVYAQKLAEFNKKHKTKYSYWEQVSEKERLSEKDLIEYEEYINWYTYIRHHKDQEYSEKFMKKMKDHFQVFALGIV